MIVGNPIIMILKAILNWFRLRRDYIANSVDKIPPEIKDALVAWYSPVKQKLSNYDVIESYSEDFTKWTKNGNVTSAVTVNNNSIVINGSIKGASIFKKSNTSIQSINIIASGVKNGDNVEYRCVKNGVLQYIPIVNGINKLPASELTENPDFNIGFVLNINSTGIINLKQIPTSILKDFSGNGNHAYLYGGKGKLNSGMGLYKVDFTSWSKSSLQTEVKPDVVKVTPNTSDYLFVQYGTKEIPSYKIKVIGLGDNVLKYQYATENGRKEINIVEGENELPTSIKGSIEYQVGYRLTTPGTSVFTITQIPDYPDQLCYDGKMYAIAYDMSILTDYTIIADRTILDNSDIADWAFIAKRDYPAINGAFTFEKDIDDTSDNLRTISFGRTSVIYKPIKERSISYQTKNKYNGQDIIAGNIDDVDFLLIGAGILDTNLNLVKEKMRVAHGDILLFNRTLTDDELDLVKEHFFGIESNIKDALMTTDKKYLALVNNNNYIKLNK